MVEERYERILSTIGHITFLYTFFFFIHPHPLHTRTWEIMGGRTTHCRIWTSVIFFSKPSPNLFVIFDYNHQITKESQDIKNPKIGRSVYSDQPD